MRDRLSCQIALTLWIMSASIHQSIVRRLRRSICLLTVSAPSSFLNAPVLPLGIGGSYSAATASAVNNETRSLEKCFENIITLKGDSEKKPAAPPDLMAFVPATESICLNIIYKVDMAKLKPPIASLYLVMYS